MTPKLSQLQYLHALKSIPSLNQSSLNKLLRHCKAPQAAWNATDQEIKSIGLSDETTKQFLYDRSKITPIDVWRQLDDLDIHIIDKKDFRYPTLLQNIPRAPHCLYAQGTLDALKKPLIAIVGSRNCTTYGKRACEYLTQQLIHHGYGIVSGLAYGIDSIAHETALKYNGVTIAVLGNGLHESKISPATKLSLALAIKDGGGILLSEYAPFTNAFKYSFPERNRIIAGLCVGTIVIEASLRSGSLITARFAKKYHRPVFATPGSIFSEASFGPHELIRKGAYLASDIHDILDTLATLYNKTPEPIARTPSKNIQNEALSPKEAELIALLSHEPIHIDKILKTITLETSQIQAMLISLELRGLIRNIGSMEYIRLYT